MIKTTILTLFTILLFDSCINSKSYTTSKMNNNQIKEWTKSRHGLKEYLQGSWRISDFGHKIDGKEIQSFIGDTLIIKILDENGRTKYSKKIRIEYFDNYGISTFVKESTDTGIFIYDDTLFFQIESIDSAWTVWAGDYGMFYSRISNDR